MENIKNLDEQTNISVEALEEVDELFEDYTVDENLDDESYCPTLTDEEILEQTKAFIKLREKRKLEESDTKIAA